jgi:hypothetical protein
LLNCCEGDEKNADLNDKIIDMLQEHKQIQISKSQLEHGLMRANVPGEPVAYIRLSPSDLEHRYHLDFQESFDNLDTLKIAILKLTSGARVALVHHEGFPTDETELYVDRDEWKLHDAVPSVLKTLDIPESQLSWRQNWPNSLRAD